MALTWCSMVHNNDDPNVDLERTEQRENRGNGEGDFDCWCSQLLVAWYRSSCLPSPCLEVQKGRGRGRITSEKATKKTSRKESNGEPFQMDIDEETTSLPLDTSPRPSTTPAYTPSVAL